jgi:hypothetical protein
MRERKRKHDDAHRPLSGKGRRSRKSELRNSPRAKLVLIEVWIREPGVAPKLCNHASYNLLVIAESAGTGKNYRTVECRKCCVRKQYRVYESGHLQLLRAVAIKKVEGVK